MHILLDEPLPRRLISELTGHTVSTVTDQGWSGLENGELLHAAVGQFDVFLTADQNLEYQQNLSELALSVVVLVAHNNKLETIRSLIPDLLDRMTDLEPRTLVKISA